MTYRVDERMARVKQSGFLYTMIRRVAEFDAGERSGERFLDILAEHLAAGRREHEFLKECQLCDIGVVRRPEYTELRYYMWCNPASEDN